MWRLGPQRVPRLVCHLPNFFKLFWRLLRDPRVSSAPKMLLLLTFAYVLLPIDLLPDILIGVGQIDDLALVLLSLQAFIRLCPREIVGEHVHAIAAGR